MKTKEYKTAGSFRTALEERLLAIRAKEGIDIQRLRRHVAFDRLLARLFAAPDAPWVLKGGYAMELRMPKARMTKDIDLSMHEARFLGDEATRNEALLELIQKAASQDLNDFFVFTIEPPVMELEAAPYGGARFPVEARLDGRSFEKFQLDVGIGDLWIEPFEMLHTTPWLEFAGVKSPSFPVIPKEQQFAEKIHAYTLPRPQGTTNSRVKDLVDMVLLISTGKINSKGLASAIKATFKQRGTHVVSESLPPPPAQWSDPFAKLAKECGLLVDLNSAYLTVQEFFKQLPL